MDWLEPVQAVVLLIIGAVATYLTQKRIESIKSERDRLGHEQARLTAIEARLRDERLKIYTAVLDPYIEVLHEVGRGLGAAEAQKRLGSVDHRKAAFQLKMVGSDDAVRAFNRFARYIVDARRKGKETPGELLRHWAELIFAIRQSIGEPTTGLSRPDMISDWVADIETVYPELGPRGHIDAEGGLSVEAGRPAGSYARVAGREISMARLEELRLLAAKWRDGSVTDDELVELFSRIPDAPGAEILLDPTAVFTENARTLDLPRPRAILDAIDRQKRGVSEPMDAQLISKMIGLLRKVRGRVIAITDSNGRRFEIKG